jgi:hypothetical protein
MATVVHESTKSVISIEEFIDYVEHDIDLNDNASVISSAKQLQSLANNKQIFLNSVHESLIGLGVNRVQAFSPANSLLGKGRTKPFVVRANLWPPIKRTQRSATEEVMFSYDLVHDHNFSFLTANYFGPGYETDVWQFTNPSIIKGEIGETVDLTFQGRLKLEPDTQIFFEQGVDIHSQVPPAEFSASINLLISDAAVRRRPQHIIDPVNKVISGYPAGTISSRRVTLMTLAAKLGTSETIDLLDQLGTVTPCSRTKSAALSAIENIQTRISVTHTQRSQRQDA